MKKEIWGLITFHQTAMNQKSRIDNVWAQNHHIDKEMNMICYGRNNMGMGDEYNGEGSCVHECDDTVGRGCASDCKFEGGSDWIGMVDWENAETNSSTWRDEEQVFGFDQNECFDGLQDLDSDFDRSVNPIL